MRPRPQPSLSAGLTGPLLRSITLAAVVQSGGFKNSRFASRPSAATPAAPRMGDAPQSDDSQGKRFGRPVGPTPVGKHFGGANSPPAGKRFGGGARRR